jgi:hypothetical protein
MNALAKSRSTKSRSVTFGLSPALYDSWFKAAERFGYDSMADFIREFVTIGIIERNAADVLDGTKRVDLPRSSSLISMMTSRPVGDLPKALRDLIVTEIRNDHY